MRRRLLGRELPLGFLRSFLLQSETCFELRLILRQTIAGKRQPALLSLRTLQRSESAGIRCAGTKLRGQGIAGLQALLIKSGVGRERATARFIFEKLAVESLTYLECIDIRHLSRHKRGGGKKVCKALGASCACCCCGGGCAPCNGCCPKIPPAKF